MKNWQVVVIVIAVVIIGTGANVWYARRASMNVTRHIREVSAEKEKALYQRLEALEKSLADSVNNSSSNTVTGVSALMERDSTRLSTDLARLAKKMDGLGRAAVPVAPTSSDKGFTGTWDMIENGNVVTLTIKQEGNSISGMFISADGRHRDEIVGTVSDSIPLWGIQRIQFTRVGEINDYEGFMMTHGDGRWQYQAIAGRFLRRDQNGYGGWFAVRAGK